MTTSSLLIILVLLLGSGNLRASGNHPQSQVQSDMRTLEMLFEEFLQNYKLPPLGNSYSSDNIISTGPELLTQLARADDPHWEWMVELFGEEKYGANPDLGFDSQSLTQTKDGPALCDPWRNPYYLLVDFDNDNHLTEPANLGKLTFTDRPFLMWSAGPDGKYGTPETNLDNLYSYPGHLDSHGSILQKTNHLRLSLLIQLVACLAMTGIIWIVQIALYPLLAQLSGEVFHNYHDRYMARVTYVIAPLMFVEALACAACFWFGNPRDFITATVLLAVIWLSTAFIQVPQHKSLTPESVPALVKSNWIRTFAWSARAVILANLLIQTNP